MKGFSFGQFLREIPCGRYETGFSEFSSKKVVDRPLFMVFTILIILGCVVGGVVVWHLIGFRAINRDPIAFGVYYIKTSIRERTQVNLGLIPDDAFRQFAKTAYRHAEFMHKWERRPMMSLFHDNLEMYVVMISNVMSGTMNECDDLVAKVLEEYGVRIPKKPIKH